MANQLSSGIISTLTQSINSLHFRNLKGDLFGGLTAAIVALPLALAFGVSSGLGPTAGLYGAICVGFFAALFGGTPSQISGPTGPMSVVMASIVVSTSADPQVALATVFTIVMLGGCFQILFGVFRLGKFLTLMPYSVISGFMSGIGAIIIVLQVPSLLGFSVEGLGAADILAQIPNGIAHFPEIIRQVNGVSTFLGVLSLGIVFFTPPKLNKLIPAPLLALVVCTVWSVVGFSDSSIVRIGEIQAGLPQLYFPRFQLNQLQEIVVFSLMLATLGSIDSLLTSLVADKITHTQHDSDRELIGQGIGNIVSGFMGGLPGAGATMRTLINVQSGGKTPLSGIFHSLILLLVMMQFRPLTEPIPAAVLAGILLKVGIDIIDWGFIKRAHRLSWKGAAIMYLVLGLTVFWDLVVAVAVGVFLANLLTIQNLTELQKREIKIYTDPPEDSSLTPEEQRLFREAHGCVYMIRLKGPMSFGAAKAIVQQISILEKFEVLILDLTQVSYLSVTAMLAIETMIQTALQKKQQVLVGANGSIEMKIQRLTIMSTGSIEPCFQDRSAALQQALAIIDSPVPLALEPKTCLRH